MHELAIAESIYRTVCEAMERNGYRSVSRIGLRIGALTDIVPDALTFGFAAIAKGTPLEATILEIESVPIRGECRDCGGKFTVEGFVFVCPHCHGRDIKMSQGDELDIAYFEVDDDTDEAPE